jgi:tRNA isopentenyl-2-thiomethyl-A-37 hydroxylase MiaE
MREIVLRDEKWEKNEHHVLKAVIKENGDLVFEGVDMGDSVKERFDDFDFEYWHTIEAKNIDTLLLHLIKEKFGEISEVLKWLKRKNIPYTSLSF